MQCQRLPLTWASAPWFRREPQTEDLNAVIAQQEALSIRATAQGQAVAEKCGDNCDLFIGRHLTRLGGGGAVSSWIYFFFALKIKEMILIRNDFFFKKRINILKDVNGFITKSPKNALWPSTYSANAAINFFSRIGRILPMVTYGPKPRVTIG